ncbi:hypothetical protein [Alkalibacterium putridalgicola]|nr:hypothetical protein [Alkalibacterium putridalgicola]
MMLSGIDTPKQGVFAYVHMMTRLGIVTFIVMLLMWQDVVKRTRRSSFDFSISKVLQVAPKKIVTSVSIVFTVLTTVYCLVMIAFQEVLNPVGGAFFYQLLLAMLLITSLIFLLFRLMKR